MTQSLLCLHPTTQSSHTAATPYTSQPSFPLLCQGCCFDYLNKKKVELELKFLFLEFLLGTMTYETGNRKSEEGTGMEAEF